MQSGLLSILEDRQGDTPAGSDTENCIKLTGNIYQCLATHSCRYRFSYGSISLCSWPHTDNPSRTLQNLPCICECSQTPDK